MQKQEKQKNCFVIAPIGEEGSDARIRSDQVLKHIITPAVKSCGYETIRADNIPEPGIITSQVIQHLVDDPLVIADLTGRNPNVFYELAVRHAVKKPCVQIIQKGEQLPFDVSQSRTISVNHHDLDSVAFCREEIIKQICAVEKNPTEVDTPITAAINLGNLRQSENPLEKSNAEIIAMLQELRSKIGEISDLQFKGYRPLMSSDISDISEDLIMLYERMAMLIDHFICNNKVNNNTELDEIKFVLSKIDRVTRRLMMETGVLYDFNDERKSKERFKERERIERIIIKKINKDRTD